MRGQPISGLVYYGLVPDFQESFCITTILVLVQDAVLGSLYWPRKPKSCSMFSVISFAFGPFTSELAPFMFVAKK